MTLSCVHFKSSNPLRSEQPARLPDCKPPARALRRATQSSALGPQDVKTELRSSFRSLAITDCKSFDHIRQPCSISLLLDPKSCFFRTTCTHITCSRHSPAFILRLRPPSAIIVFICCASSCRPILIDSNKIFQNVHLLARRPQQLLHDDGPHVCVAFYS